MSIRGPGGRPAQSVLLRHALLGTALALVVSLVLAATTARGGLYDTKLVKNINGKSRSSDPEEITKFGSRAFFSATTAARGRELWKSNGTAAGTKLVIDLAGGDSNPESLEKSGGSLFFGAERSSRRFLWATNGSAATTRKIEDNTDFIGPLNPTFLTNLGGGTFLFRARGGGSGTKLWTSDGTETGTHAVKDLNVGSDPLLPRDLARVGGTMFMAATDIFSGGQPQSDYELWKSDGSPTGTVRVKDINPSAQSDPHELTNVDGELLFAADNGTLGNELWKSDGTEPGTKLVRDINGGAPGSSPSGLTEAGGLLFFGATTPGHGNEPWRSDGSGSGTFRVKDINPGGAGSSPTDFAEGPGNAVFFSADGPDGRELWKSDGSPNTVQVKDINPFGDSDPRDLTRIGPIVYFSAETGKKSDRELWASDGTAAGTRRVKNINPTGSGNPEELAKIGNSLYFSAKDKRGRELWRTVALFVEVQTPSVSFRFTDPQTSIKRVAGRATCTSDRGCPEVRVDGRLKLRASGGRFELKPVRFSLHAGESHRFKLGFPQRAKKALKDSGKAVAKLRVASIEEAHKVGTDSVKVKIKPR